MTNTIESDNFTADFRKKIVEDVRKVSEQLGCFENPYFLWMEDGLYVHGNSQSIRDEKARGYTVDVLAVFLDGIVLWEKEKE